MIDLNQSKFDVSPYITKEQILSVVSEEELFRYYCKDLKIGSAVSSPFRKDKHPSFGVFYSNKHSCLLYKDLTTGEVGGVIEFVKKLYNISDNKSTLLKIAQDFNIDIGKEDINYDKIKVDREDLNFKYKNSNFDIKVKRREWRDYDYKFWAGFGISPTTLELYNVVPISIIFINNVAITADKYAYAYLEYKDNNLTFKIYQPFSDKYKWITNHSYSAHQGYIQLPKTGKLILITKSLKDVMSLRDCCMIPSIGIQAESVLVKPSVMDEYKNRFDKVICLFDNDEQGIRWSKRFKDEYNLDYILIPDKYKSKDFSDLVKMVGKYNAKNVLNELLCI